MADTVPSLETLPRVATAAHLTEVLRRAGVLGDAAVDEVVVDSARLTLLSRIIRLRLSYDSATEGAPPTLIMKTTKPGRGESRWVGGQQEVAFYTHVAPQMKPCLVPRCFDAAWDAATKDWHVLLEDLTETHAVPTAWPLPPTLAQCEHIIDVLARFHAAWWGDPRLGVSVGTLRDAAGRDRLMQDLTQHFGRFADAATGTAHAV